MFSPPAQPHDLQTFLRNLELEVLSGVPLKQDLVDVRLAEYLDPDAPVEVEHALRHAAAAHLDALLARRAEEEASWVEPTDHDRLQAALGAMASHGVHVPSHAGKTQEDGWAYAGISCPDEARGVAFVQQQDIYDALHGRHLWVAFGATPWSDVEDEGIGRVVASVLAQHGLQSLWAGVAADRVVVPDFVWAARRFTSAPEVRRHSADYTPIERRRASTTSADDFHQAVYATYDAGAYDSWLFDVMRGAGSDLGYVLPQLQHVGLPHAFLPAGETAVFRPWEGWRNLQGVPREALFNRGRRPRR